MTFSKLTLPAVVTGATPPAHKGHSTRAVQVECLVNQPALMSYCTLSSAERQAASMMNDFVRYVLGIEDAADLIADLGQALCPQQA